MGSGQRWRMLLSTGSPSAVFLHVVGDEFAGGGQVAPAVGGEDGAVHLRVQLAQAQDVRVAFVAGRGSGCRWW